MSKNFTIKSISMTTKCTQCKRDGEYQARLGYDPATPPIYCPCGAPLEEVVEFKGHCSMCGNRKYVKTLKCKLRVAQDKPFPWGLLNEIKHMFQGKLCFRSGYEGRNLIFKPKNQC